MESSPTILFPVHQQDGGDHEQATPFCYCYYYFIVLWLRNNASFCCIVL